MVRAEFPRARLIENADNRGFSAANNQALRAIEDDGGCDLVLLFNPDAELIGDGLDTAIATLARRPEVGVLGVRLLYPTAACSPRPSASRPGVNALEASGLYKLLPPRAAARPCSPATGRTIASATSTG